MEGERDQSRFELGHRYAKLLRDLVAEWRRADLGDGYSAAGDDQRMGAVSSARRRHKKRIAALYLFHVAWHAPAHACPIAFGLEHGDDGFRSVVTEQLSERFFLIADAMFVQHGNEVLRREARQRRTAEVRILRQIIFRLGVQVGEVAAPASRDADLLGE